MSTNPRSIFWTVSEVNIFRCLCKHLSQYCKAMRKGYFYNRPTWRQTSLLLSRLSQLQLKCYYIARRSRSPGAGAALSTEKVAYTGFLVGRVYSLHSMYSVECLPASSMFSYLFIGPVSGINRCSFIFLVSLEWPITRISTITNYQITELVSTAIKFSSFNENPNYVFSNFYN